MDEIENKIKHIWANMKSQSAKTPGGKCPDEAQLSYYLDGILSAYDKENMEKHLLQCNNCLSLVLLNEKVKANDAAFEVPSGWVERVKNLVSKKQGIPQRLFDIVLKFTKDTIEIIKSTENLFISYGAVPVPVRGGAGAVPANSITLSRTFADIKSELEIEKAENDRFSIGISTSYTDSGAPEPNLRISLFNPEQEVASFVAESGEVCFNSLRLGQYTIKITRADRVIGEISMDLNN
ncbi:MAG: zf-HC2 domain-containing protein [Nitrospirae bacterium]|nr:zf-HC2 domain-containing protein [Nitrospirota bacterium]